MLKHNTKTIKPSQETSPAFTVAMQESVKAKLTSVTRESDGVVFEVSIKQTEGETDY